MTAGPPVTSLSAKAPLMTRPVLCLWIGLVLVLHAGYVDVVISPLFYNLPVLAVMLVPGGLATFFLLRHRARSRYATPFSLVQAAGVVILPVFIGLGCWLVIAKTPAWAAAAVFGSPHSEAHDFEVKLHRQKGCNAHVRATPALRMFPGHLCVPEAYALRYQGQKVRLRLVGSRTPLGFRITDVEHLAVADMGGTASPP
jgi:hypothetical protein